MIDDEHSSLSVASDFLEDSSGAEEPRPSSGQDKDAEERRLIEKNDSVEVSRWKMMVIVMLFLTAALVITSTYLFLSSEEKDEFEKSVSVS